MKHEIESFNSNRIIHDPQSRHARSDFQPVLIISCIAILLFLTQAVAADTGFSLSPGSMTINTETGQSLTRTFLILGDTPGTNITGIQVVSLDLIRTDNQKAIPASAITPQPPASVIPPEGFLKVPVSFDFASQPCGEFAGNLLVSSNTSRTMMPVLVKLKEPVLIPALVLLISTFASVIIYDYATKGLKADKLKIKMEDIERRLPSEFAQDSPDHHFTTHFKEKILIPFSSARMKIHQGEYDAAATDFSTGETAWNHWNGAGDQWKERLEESKKIESDLEELSSKVKPDLPDQDRPEDLALFETIQIDLETIWEDAAKTDTKPETTRTAIGDLATRITLFNHTYDDIKKAIDGLQDQETGLECLKNLRKEILNLNFVKNDKETTDFLAGYMAKKNECLKKIENDVIHSDTLILLQRISPFIDEFNAMSEAERSAPLTKPLPIKEDKPEEHSRLPTWLTGAIVFCYEKFHSIFIPAIILFIIGLSQLYSANMTFGANFWSDYSTLILWGFGTGPASDSIVTLVKEKGPK
jgi:hypothetical protein